ncbi:MAG: M1 family metallopeptidase [Chitinophagaceae bacterium]
MKKLLAVLFLFYFNKTTIHGQANYWQQQADYFIDVSLNDKDQTLDGFEKLEYTNNSPDTLHFIWFHLWPNAYKNDKTAFSDQLLENGNTKFYFSNKEERGYINRLDFKVNNITAETEDHPEHIDIIKVILPNPLAPHQSITISTPFHVKLPYNFSRGGYDGDSYQVTQWFPKPAVYDKNGWHPIPYLDQGEFYSEFGNFNVQITVPKNYVVAATGELQNAEEKEWLNTRKNFTWSTVTRKVKSKGGITKTVRQTYPPSDKETKTIRYIQSNVHDFAWFADKRFIVKHDTCKLESGNIIDVYAYYTGKESASWQAAVSYSKDAIRYYSSEVGEYPYKVASVVQGPQSFGGGMEYPTITVISPGIHGEELDGIIAHELGHNWFYGVLGSDERKHPWMDEGINSFYEAKYGDYKKNKATSHESILFETKAVVKTDQPIETSSEKFSYTNYGLVGYYKTAAWMRWLESTIGKEKLKAAMHDYFNEWQFKHPQPEDLKKTLEKSTGQNLDSEFNYLAQPGLLPSEKRKGTDVITIFQPEKFGSEWQNKINAKKNIIRIGPSAGFNSYDKFMVGGLITNYVLPPTKFKFFLAPMYATGSKQFTGIGTIHYTFYPNSNLFRSVDLFANGSKFTSDSYADSAGVKTYLGYIKFVHGFRITLKEQDPRSTMHRFIQWKTYWFNEDGLKFSRDTIVTGADTSIQNSYRKISDSRTLRQLRIVIENNRALYPYNGELKMEYAEDFIRTAFTGNYFFNYANNGGLNVRLFAGKFFYRGEVTSAKQFNTDRYQLNMTGANGYEDYTYSDYFIGRNKFDGMASQQIMQRDGGFKIRTDLLATKIGKTDNWLASMNFTSSLPVRINLPVKVFADLGTYSDAWASNSNLDRFLFEAGLQFSVLKETINIYLPLIYSRELKSYIQSYLPKNNRWLRTISFTIDMANFNLRKVDRNLVF